jgi:cardiolipin synthase A/B
MSPFYFYLIYASVGWCIRLGMIPVILRRQLAPGASMAWLGIVFIHPYIGGTLYMMLGESRLGPRRERRRAEVMKRFRDPTLHLDRQPHLADTHLGPEHNAIVMEAEKTAGLPVLDGNGIEFIADSPQFFQRLIDEINSAKKSVHLLYYIWGCDLVGQRIAEAVAAAARRGVECRVLADALASRQFLGNGGLSRPLQQAGVQVTAALPVAPIRQSMARMDLRNHRKLAIIDNHTAYAGSHNLIDPSYGGKRGNPWVDVSAKFTGPVVSELALVFAEDWYFETGRELSLPSPQALDPAGEVAMQVVPTGPPGPRTTYRKLLLTAIDCSRQRLMFTTPYFVPDEPTMVALNLAADRGVEVTLILPRVSDSYSTAFASRANFQTLLDVGVKIYLFEPGLLHAKTTTIDDAFSIFGSANVDVRSFNLNFELNLLLYGKPITDQLRQIQRGFLAQSKPIDPAAWRARPAWSQYADRAVALMSPLL